MWRGREGGLTFWRVVGGIQEWMWRGREGGLLLGRGIPFLTVFLFAFPLSLSFFGPIIKGQSNTKKFKSGKKYSNKLRTSYSAGGLSRTDAYPLAEKGRGARSGRLGQYEYRKSVRGPMHFLLKFFGRAPIWSSIEAVEYRGTTVSPPYMVILYPVNSQLRYLVITTLDSIYGKKIHRYGTH